jgi:predicted dehydrogenase
VNFEAKVFSYPRRFLICGLGSIGRRHARVIHHAWPSIELAVMRSGLGPDCPELSLMSHQFSDFDSAIDWKPDAAVIASPAPFHQQQALVLAKQGISLLIEKPVGMGSESLQAWDELLELSACVPILVGYVLRHDPCAAYVKQRIESHELGRILDADFYCGSWLPEWRSNVDYRESVSGRRSLGGGVLLELSHELDLARWLLGELEVSFASLQKSGILEVDVADQALLVGCSDICSLITIRLNFCSQPSRRNIVIRCEGGEISWDLLSGQVNVLIRDCSAQEFQSGMVADDRYRVQAEHFIECIRGDAEPHCSLFDGLQVLNVINQAQFQAASQESKPCAAP